MGDDNTAAATLLPMRPDSSMAPPRSWGRSIVQTACPLDCPDSCSVEVTVERGRITKIDGGRQTSTTGGYICGKVRTFDRRVYSPERVQHPGVRKASKGVGDFERLTWDESIPAQTGTILGLQSTNVAVSGFATDQAYLLLQSELPHFRRPVAVVTLFMPLLFDRNLNDDRPHVGSGLIWLPAVKRWRLQTIARFLVPYRSDAAIERGVSVTREVLRATIELARARGAVPLIVVPQFIPEAAEEREIRRRVLYEAGLPYVCVELDAGWRVPDDGHPDARAAHAIAHCEEAGGAMRPRYRRPPRPSTPRDAARRRIAC